MDEYKITHEKYKKSGAVMAIAFIMTQNILYGFGNPISKVAYETVELYSFLSIRYTIAFAVLLLIFKKTIIRELKKVKVITWLIPSLLISISFIFDNLALNYTAATNAAFIRSMSICLTPVLSFLILHKRYSLKHIPVQAAVILGLYLLVGYGGLSTFGTGEIYAALSALFTAGALVSSFSAMKQMSAASLACVQSGVSAVLVIIITRFTDSGFTIDGFNTNAWLIVIYLGIMCTLAGFFLQNLAVVYIPASSVALWQCLCPVMTAIFSFILLGEAMTPIGITGSLILVCCTAADTVITRRDEE